MTDKDAYMIFAVEEQAFRDDEFQKLCIGYEQAHERFLDVLHSLPDEQQAVIGDYLYASVGLYQRLMVLACNYAEKKGTV